ncbi:MAG TPA: hypothetical protein VMW56_21725 [Candidatus Margulisiibacteriota bacterium]|nr:hypothetical protein [Candidatus Margulisiibacteriota bacterium]
MKKTDDLLKNAQDLEFRRAELVRAGIIRVTPERDVPAEDQESDGAAPLQDESK